MLQETVTIFVHILVILITGRSILHFTNLLNLSPNQHVDMSVYSWNNSKERMAL